MFYIKLRKLLLKISLISTFITTANMNQQQHMEVGTIVKL